MLTMMRFIGVFAGALALGGLGALVAHEPWRLGAAQTVRWAQAHSVKALGAAGFALADIYVDGRVRQDAQALRDALGVYAGEPLFAMDLPAMQARLEALPWIAHARLVRRWPDILYVRVTERIPFLLWQQGASTRLLDREGNVLARDNLKRFAYLPRFVGEKDPSAAIALMEQLQDYPELRRHIVGGQQLSARRWVLHLEEGGRLHLPAEHDKIAQSLARFLALQGARQMLAEKNQEIDLRFGDRILLRPLERRAARKRRGEI